MSEATQVRTTPPSSAWAVEQNAALLRELASKYIWWMTPAEAMDYPGKILAQVMNTGEYHDACALNAALGDDGLRAVLAQAEAGQFNERSWHYWHYRLGRCEPGQVPPLPVRRID